MHLLLGPERGIKIVDILSILQTLKITAVQDPVTSQALGFLHT